MACSPILQRSGWFGWCFHLSSELYDRDGWGFVLYSLSSITAGVEVEVGLFLLLPQVWPRRSLQSAIGCCYLDTMNLPSLGVSLCHRIGTMVPPGLSVGLRIIKHTDCTGGFSAAEKRWMATNKVQLPVLWKARITCDKSEIHKEDEIQQHSPEFM